MRSGLPKRGTMKFLISGLTRRRWLRLAWRFEPCRARLRRQRHRSRVTTSSEGGDEPDRAPGRLACLLPPGSTGAGSATSRATYHEPRCRARGCSTAHWQGGSHGLLVRPERPLIGRSGQPRDGKSRSVAQDGVVRLRRATSSASKAGQCYRHSSSTGPNQVIA